MLFHDVTNVKSGGEHAVDILRNTLRQQTPYTLKHQSRTLLHVTLWRCFSNHALTGTAQPTSLQQEKQIRLPRVWLDSRPLAERVRTGVVALKGAPLAW